MSFTAKQSMFLDTAKVWAEKSGKNLGEVTKNDLTDIAASGGLKFPHWINTLTDFYGVTCLHHYHQIHML